MDNLFNFSIIIPFINSEKYLEKTLISLIKQETSFLENIQVILLNNGSTDKSTIIANYFQKLYPNNVMVITEENIAKAKNQALSIATGKYISFVGSNDFLSGNVIKDLLITLQENEHPNVIKIPTKTIGVNENIEEEIGQTVINPKVDSNIPYALESLFVKRNQFNEKCFDENNKDAGDLLVLDDILSSNSQIHVSPGWYNTRVIADIREKDFYLNKISIYNELLSKVGDENQNYLQYIVLSDLNKLLNNSHLNLFEDDDEKRDYINSIQEIVQQLDEEKILTQHYENNNIKKLLIYLKDNNQATDNLEIYNVFNKLFINDNEEKFTIILSDVDEGKNLQESVDSLINQTLSFKENVQLIVLDTFSNKNSNNLMEDYLKTYPNNISIIRESNIKKAKISALKMAKGSFITFLNSSDLFLKNVLENVLNTFKENGACNLVKIAKRQVGIKKYPEQPFEEEVKSIDNSSYIPYSLESLFIKQNLLEDYEFDENIEFDDLLLLNHVLKDNDEFYFVKSIYDCRTINKQEKTKDFYTNKIKTYDEIINSTDKTYSQYLVLNDLYDNLNDSFIDLFESEKEKSDYLNSIQNVVQKIDKEKIVTFEHENKDIKKLLLYLKDDLKDSSLSNLEIYELFNRVFIEENELNNYQSNLFNFTIIIHYSNLEKNLDKTITSIIYDQSLNFKENTQIILINDKSTDNSTEIAKFYRNLFPDNIIIINEENINKARNLALKYATGKYITFVDGADYISPHTLENILNQFPENEEVNIIKLSVEYIGVYNTKKSEEQRDELIDLTVTPQKTQKYQSLFIKTKLFENLQFDETQSDLDGMRLLNQIIEENPIIGVAKGQYSKVISYNDLEIELEYRSSKDYYTNKIKTYKELIANSTDENAIINDYTQYYILDDMNQLLSTPHLYLFESNTQKKEYLHDISDIINQLDSDKISTSDLTYTHVKKFMANLSSIQEHEKINIYSITENGDSTVIQATVSVSKTDESLKINYILENGEDTQELNCKVSNIDDLTILPLTLNDEMSHKYLVEVTLPTAKLIDSKNYFEIVTETTQYSPNILLKTSIKGSSINSINVNNKLLAYNNIADLMFLEYLEEMDSEYYINKKEYEYKFSIVMPVYDTGRFLEEAITSITEQTIGFEENVQLILIDDGSTDNSKEITRVFKEQYPINITLIEKTHSGQASSRDLGLKIAKGKYINFLDSDDYLEKDTLEKVYNYFNQVQNQTDVITIPMHYTDRLEKEHPLNYKYAQTRVINLESTYNYPQFSIASAFIKTEVLKRYEFDTSLVFSDDALLINKVFLERLTCGLLNNTHYNYRLRFSEDNLTDDITSNKKYYTHRLEHFYKHLINYSLEKFEEVPMFIQYTLATDLNNLCSVRELDALDDKDEVRELWHYLTDDDDKYDILTYISDECIKDNDNIKLPLRSFIMYLKNRKYTLTVSKKGIVRLATGNLTIDVLNNHGLWFDIFEVRFNKLVMSGHFVSNFYPETISLKIIKEKDGKTEKEYDCEYIEYAQEDRSHLRSLSVDWRYDYNFNVEVPLHNVYNASFHFELTYDEPGKRSITVTPNLGFRVPSGVTEFNKYFVQESRIVFYEEKQIYIIPYSYKSMLKKEFRTLQLIFADRQPGFLKIVFYRMLYMLLYQFMKNKRIWFFNDRLDRADENGIHLFRYASKQNDGIDKYYILDKHCDDYKRLKKTYGGKILAHNSFKHKLLYFFTEKRISPFLNESFFNPFWIDGNYDIRKIYCNLVTSPWYFIQHGVIYRDLTSHIKRYKYNLALIVTSSERERQSFFDLDYKFPEDVVQILGLPRYDNLIKDNEIKKQILFTPTWRLQLEKDESLFLNSDYYQMLSDFLNNEDLFNLLDEYGYKFIFKPHPQLVKHLDSFEMNENVIISTEESYQELIRDSALMISDVSSVISDFAYLKKPIIYYQKNNDHHFEPFFDYVTEGFGDVFVTEEDVVKKVKYYLDNNCEMEDKFKDRVTNFFKFNDKNNCKRVYEWILKH